MSNTPDFGFDETPSTAGAQTFHDPQGGGSGAVGGKYAALSGQQADLKDFEGKSVKCVGFASAPRVTKANDRGEVYVWISLTVCEPSELAGRKDDFGGLLLGGDSSKRQRTLQGLAKLANQIGAKWDAQNLETTMESIETQLANVGSCLKWTLAKGSNAGSVFVNM